MRWVAVLFAVFGFFLPNEPRSEERTFGPYKADEMEINGFTGLLEVIVVQDHETTITMDGEPTSIRDFAVLQEDNKLILRSPPPTSKNSTIIVNGNIQADADTDLIIGNKHYKAGEPFPEPIKLRIELPEGLPLSINGFTGDGVIGNTLGPLQLRLLSGQIEGGKVGDSVITIEGGGDVILAAIEGRADLSIQGAGLIQVHEGRIDDLVCSISGAGTIEVGGQVHSAKTSISGAGTIDLAHVSGQLDRMITGAGEILVHNHP